MDFSKPTMSTKVLKEFLFETSTIAANIVLAEAGLTDQILSQNEACKRYGRVNVERWGKERNLQPVESEDSSRIKYLKSDLDILSTSDDRFTKHKALKNTKR